MKNPKNLKTLIIVILDESGSMDRKKSGVIEGFNDFIEEQKQIKNDSARLYLVKFNTVVTPVHKGIPLENVPELTKSNYFPGGQTALFDAISESVRIAEKDKTEEERVICVIMTDGEENSSRETTKKQIRNIISSYEAKGDWTFLYIGENPERWARESHMSLEHGISFNHRNPEVNYRKASSAISAFRCQPKKKAKNLFSFLGYV